MSRNAPPRQEGSRSFPLGRFVLSLLLLVAPSRICAEPFSLASATNPASQVVIVENPNATEAFRPRSNQVEPMLRTGLLRLTGEKTEAQAWLRLVSPEDVIGLKIYSRPGANSGTRPLVVSAVAKSLIAAGIPARNIVIWDRDEADLREAGFYQLATELNVRIAAASKAGWSETNFYDSPLIGTPVFGDLEFEKKGESIGRKSFVSKLVAQELTKIINLTPLLNHNEAGVCGNLYSLAMGSTDNILRFDGDANRLATAVPEIYALPSVGDKVVLNITDALICQYEGGQRGLLHYSTMLNQLRFSRDPVALDALSLKELDAQRRRTKAPLLRPNVELYRNAALLELGVADPAQMSIETVR